MRETHSLRYCWFCFCCFVHLTGDRQCVMQAHCRSVLGLLVDQHWNVKTHIENAGNQDAEMSMCVTIRVCVWWVRESERERKSVSKRNHTVYHFSRMKTFHWSGLALFSLCVSFSTFWLFRCVWLWYMKMCVFCLSFYLSIHLSFPLLNLLRAIKKHILSKRRAHLCMREHARALFLFFSTSHVNRSKVRQTKNTQKNLTTTTAAAAMAAAKTIATTTKAAATALPTTNTGRTQISQLLSSKRAYIWFFGNENNHYSVRIQLNECCGCEWSRIVRDSSTDSERYFTDNLPSQFII